MSQPMAVRSLSIKLRLSDARQKYNSAPAATQDVASTRGDEDRKVDGGVGRSNRAAVSSRPPDCGRAHSHGRGEGPAGSGGARSPSILVISMRPRPAPEGRSGLEPRPPPTPRPRRLLSRPKTGGRSLSIPA